VEIVKSLYLNEKSSDFDEIWYTTANLELNDSHMTKYHFKNSRWRTIATLKILALTQQLTDQFQLNVAWRSSFSKEFQQRRRMFSFS